MAPMHLRSYKTAPMNFIRRRTSTLQNKVLWDILGSFLSAWEPWEFQHTRDLFAKSLYMVKISTPLIYFYLQASLSLINDFKALVVIIEYVKKEKAYHLQRLSLIKNIF